MGRIFEVMTDRDQGWIASEIAVDSGLTEVQVGRRLSDLEERGLVVRTPDYRRNAKGNLEQVTRRTDLHPSAAVKPTRSETERLDLGKVSAQSYLSVMVGMPIRRPGTYRVYAMRIGD
jgi:DNA-binding transcriptional regulator LsrR (DeoR family)